MLGLIAAELRLSALRSSAQVRIDCTPALARTKLSSSAHPYDRAHSGMTNWSYSSVEVDRS